MEKYNKEIMKKIKLYGDQKLENDRADIKYDITYDECDLIFRLRHMETEYAELLKGMIRQYFMKYCTIGYVLKKREMDEEKRKAQESKEVADDKKIDLQENQEQLVDKKQKLGDEE